MDNDTLAYQELHGWREKDGRLIHDGDCWFWSTEICTCGLLHHLMRIEGLPDWFGKEQAAHDRQIARILKPLAYLEPTKEELAKRYDFLNDF